MRHIWCPLLTAKGAAKLKKYLLRSRRGTFTWSILTAEMRPSQPSKHQNTFFEKYWKRNFKDPPKKNKNEMLCDG